MKKILFTLTLLLGSLSTSMGGGNPAYGCAAAVPALDVQRLARKALPRGKTDNALRSAMQLYWEAVDSLGLDIHSVMVVQHGRVVAEEWRSEGAADKPHAMNSVSKTFTSIAVGLCVSEGLLHLDDRLVTFFPDQLPLQPSAHLQAVTLHHLLTMNSGQDTDPSGIIQGKAGADWVREFLACPFPYEPGTWTKYNSMGTYMLSAIVQKVTGQTVLEYLQPRLFQPLGIRDVHWDVSPQGITCGGWGLQLTTEDMAKVGQTLLRGGKWRDRQVIPAEWVTLMTTKQVETWPDNRKPDHDGYLRNDWLVGYGYQMWQCTHGAVRADGSRGQFIVLLPEQDAVVVNTANTGQEEVELRLIWDCILPGLRDTRRNKE